MENEPRLRVRSIDALRPRSATSGAGRDSRDRPAASVSSVNGVGAKNPCPADSRRGESRPPKQCRKARAQESPVLIVKIRAGARRNAKPGSNVEIVLHEHAWDDIGVRETWNVLRTIGIALRRGACYPCVPADTASDGNLAEEKFVPVIFDHLPELMPVLLFRCREAGRHDITVFNQPLHIAAEIIAARVQGLRVRLARGRERGSRQGAAGAILVSHAARQQRRAAVLVIPEETRPDHAAAVTSEIRPSVAVNVAALLPIAAAKQRGAPMRG